MVEQDLKDDQRVTRSVKPVWPCAVLFCMCFLILILLGSLTWVWHEVNRSYKEGIKNPDIQAINRVNQQTYGILESANFCVGCE